MYPGLLSGGEVQKDVFPAGAAEVCEEACLDSDRLQGATAGDSRTLQTKTGALDAILKKLCNCTVLN